MPVEITDYYGTLETIPRGSVVQHFAFDVIDAGLLDCLIPYRMYMSNAEDREKVIHTLALPGVVLVNGVVCLFKAPYYALHDIVKTLLLPLGIVHYL
jgi:hypothetical protein